MHQTSEQLGFVMSTIQHIEITTRQICTLRKPRCRADLGKSSFSEVDGVFISSDTLILGHTDWLV